VPVLPYGRATDDRFSATLLSQEEVMGTIKLVDLDDLAELCVELLKKGATYMVKKTGDGYWTIEITGF
jgi:hypothetical protein